MNEKVNELPGILILSHGPLCTAMIESAKMIVGETPNVTALPFRAEDDLEQYGLRANAIYSAMPEGSIVLYDLFSGTPFNQMLARCGGRPIDGLCGVSLPVLLDALSMRECMSGDALVRALEESAHAGIVNVRTFMQDTLQV